MHDDEYWSRQSIISNGSDTRVGSNVNSFDVVTGAVPATISPTPKLEWEKYIKKKWAGLYQCIFLVPFVDDVKALYRLLWLLAVVGGQCHRSNAFA